MLYLLAGLNLPLSGTIRIDGRGIIRPRPQSALILQDHGLLPWATVRQNVALGLRIQRLYGPDGKHAPKDSGKRKPADLGRTVDTWLGRLGIAALADSYPLQLSRGQRQRTAIARSLVMQPDLLLLDEPFSALDAPTRRDLQQLILTLNLTSGLTTIVVTHDIEEAVRMGRHILVLSARHSRQPVRLSNPCWNGAGTPGKQDSAAMCRKLEALLGARL